MAIFIGLLLGLISMVLLALPVLTRGRRGPRPVSPLGSLDEIRQRRRQIYDEMRSLILDYQLGNLSPRDFQGRLEIYRLQAAYALREEDGTQEALRGVEAALEDDVLNLRRSWGSVDGVVLCKRCGHEMDVKAPLCPRCATSLHRMGLAPGEGVVGEAP